MKLIRLATVYLQPIPAEFTPLSMQIGNVRVNILAASPTDNFYRLLVAAELALESPVIVNEIGIVEIPEDIRIETEKAVEHYANIISVRDGLGRTIKSPMLSIALNTETEEERKLLSPAIAVKTSAASIIGVKPKIDLAPDQLTHA